MSAWLRAGLFAALFVFVTTPSPAAEKTFQDDALDDAAITLEAELKDEAGTVEKPLAKLKQEAEALLKRQDLEGAANVYVQIVTLAPDDAKAWRRLADIWLLIPATERGRRLDADRAGAHRRSTSPISASTTPEEESASLVTLANAFTKREEWRQALNALKLALELHADARAADDLRRPAREIWLPRLEFQRRLRCGEPARLLPVHRDPAQAHRLFALRVGRRSGQARAVGRRRSKSASRD